MKYVYSFKEGNKEMKNLLGGKGANLAEMTNIGLSVPQGFTITTEACNKYYADGEVLSKELIDEIFLKIEELEQLGEKRFGDPEKPLLFSLRSGSRASMPGMMDTILNLGLNDEAVATYSQTSNNPRFVYDSYRRFIQMFADVVGNFPKGYFDRILDKVKEEKGVNEDADLTVEDLKELVNIYEEEYFKYAGEQFPQDPKEQLLAAVRAVFRSWNNPRAVSYRRMNDIPSDWGTAVNVQEMVFGNNGNNSGTGVAFTRNPATGEKEIYGEYLINAQGEDVVAGIRTPEPIATLKDWMPECYDEFVRVCDILEKHYKDMQDMEFTIENGKLYMLQTRSGKRTAQAALKISIDFVNEGMLSKEEALMLVNPRQLDQLLHPMFDANALKAEPVIAKGLAASPGAATGKIYFTAEDVTKAHVSGEKEIILVRLETSPEDIEGMNLASGILTARGGMTSHAAVVARGMGTCCVSGSADITIDEASKTMRTKDGSVYKEGDCLSLDGSTGNVYGRKLETVEAEISGDFSVFMSWADKLRRLEVRANADTPKEAQTAKEFGAEGIGLCRTEHMFFEQERIFNFRRMITADNLETRKEALDLIIPYQRGDFEQLFREMDGLPVTVRFLDPPLHEFLPHTDEEIRPLANSLNMTFDDLKARVESLKEFNPMMGHRGCRLAITYPEIAQMQTRAIIEAALNVQKEGIKVKPEIMIPLIGTTEELEFVKKDVVETADSIIKESGTALEYTVGTMIELPRSCLIANKIAKEAEFFSFGTNDLTQMAYGFSRDDAAKFLEVYYDKQIFDADPFTKIDQEGVGELMKIAVDRGRLTRPNIQLGICGEHGGDPSSVEFCHRLGLDYVSCSPYRIPIARLAAAQAAIKAKNN